MQTELRESADSLSSFAVIAALVKKDWDLMRWPILMYWLGGVLSIAIIVMGGEPVAMLAIILFVTALGATAVHLVIQTILQERNDQTLPFVMSLPITPTMYTTSKMVMNFSVFFCVWVTLSSGAFFIFFFGDEGFPNGTIPFFCIILVGIFMSYAIMLTTGIVTESQGWTIVAIVVGNIGLQIAIWTVASLHGIRSVVNGPDAVWNTTALSLIGGEIVVILSCIALTFLIQSRKRDFT